MFFFCLFFYLNFLNVFLSERLTQQQQKKGTEPISTTVLLHEPKSFESFPFTHAVFTSFKKRRCKKHLVIKEMCVNHSSTLSWIFFECEKISWKQLYMILYLRWKGKKENSIACVRTILLCVFLFHCFNSQKNTMLESGRVIRLSWQNNLYVYYEK